jgi:hypothetical protein
VFVAVARSLSLMACTLQVAACSHIVIVPAEEYKYFEAKKPSLRIIEAPKIFFSFANNTDIICETLIGKLQTNERYLGCAHWQPSAQKCTVFVPPNIENVILGHEVRHCFEGAFH